MTKHHHHTAGVKMLNYQEKKNLITHRLKSVLKIILRLHDNKNV
jgi:hypothetical protein